MDRDEALQCRFDLKRFMIRSRRRTGWWEFSARLFSPLWEQCSTPAGFAALEDYPYADVREWAQAHLNDL